MKFKTIISYLAVYLALGSILFIGAGNALATTKAPNPFTALEKTAGLAFGDDIANQIKSTQPTIIIGRIIGTVLSFVGVLFLVLTIYGGFLWMTAGGSDEKVGKAVNLVTQAGIGLAIVLAAYLLTRYVGTAILNALSSSA